MTGEIISFSLEKRAIANAEGLRANPYPGRGIVMGMDANGTHAIQLYWIMGRSDNSRNRVLKSDLTDPATVKTAPFDPSKVEDPSLIIYTAMKSLDGTHIVSNGAQTDTIAKFLGKGKSFKEALNTQTYEPDKPNFTPRISGLLDLHRTFQADFSVIRRDGWGLDPIRSLYHYILKPGIGMCIHTYEGDGKPLPSFKGDPYAVPLNDAPDDIAEFYWGLLNPDNRIALVAKSVDLRSGVIEIRTINKHPGIDIRERLWISPNMPGRKATPKSGRI